MTPLTPVDQLFLLLEKRQQPMHVAGLHLYSFPEGADSKYISELAEQLRSFSCPEKPFNQKLVSKFGQHYWEEDHQFDLEHHFRHEALPRPGRIRELLARVSAEHSNLMDRERPLWEYHLIEGIRGKRFALYMKVHHSMMDGVGAMRMTIRSLSKDPTATNMPPVWAMPPRQAKKKKPDADGHVDWLDHVVRMSGSAGKQLSTIPALAREVMNAIRKSSTDPNFVSAFQAPQCLLNQKVTGSRRFAAQSYPIERFKRIAKPFGATLNDVVLAVCGSALRNYLISQHALPDAPLIAMVPMSLRRDESEGGNQVALILANLGTHIADPADRIELVRSSVLDGKETFSQLTPEEAINYTAMMMAPAGLNLLTGLVPQWQAFNVIISNIPGPREPLYFNGARLEGMYPVSIPLDRVALNITLLSYTDQMEFGLTACRRSLPSMQRLLDYIENGIEELEVAANIK
ncbi:MAG: wax ester/triacylglycerol synthase family O-acyltransferase [Proteobacteria bacterium]|nr:MAG: wax ester/triacylglycerol synthase family O-acyltransferase [Pseudomonadota bacterium]